MLRIFLCICILLSMNLSECLGKSTVTSYPIGHPYNRGYERYHYNMLSNDLSALEKYTLNRSYPRENPIQRLERLENLAFGSIQNGDIRYRYKNVESAILSRPKHNYAKKSLLNNIADYFAGQSTGLSPAIAADDYYGSGYYNNYYPNYNQYSRPSDYGMQRIDQFSHGIFGGGYNLRNNAFGNGSSIRVIP